jgi:hypothetical protein
VTIRRRSITQGRSFPEPVVFCYTERLTGDQPFGGANHGADQRKWRQDPKMLRFWLLSG